ncbi:hypothetical protein J3Q64DRAFT_1216401 [Phycomyces blakesleeanus]|uniref:Uncharacterized protein n=1 Tax=Phycomyces blakesleeanus TaxID=4837 RepID=A0ABR3B985_PHYBL
MNLASLSLSLFYPSNDSYHFLDSIVSVVWKAYLKEILDDVAFVPANIVASEKKNQYNYSSRDPISSTRVFSLMLILLFPVILLSFLSLFYFLTLYLLYVFLSLYLLTYYFIPTLLGLINISPGT